VKKSAVLVLIFIYATSVIGLAVNKFYCCGKLESVSFIANHDHLQAEKDTKEAGCCKNEKESFKVKDSHISSEKVTIDAKFQEIAPISVISIISFNHLSITEYIANFIKGPPKYRSTPFYIFNCIFRL